MGQYKATPIYIDLNNSSLIWSNRLIWGMTYLHWYKYELPRMGPLEAHIQYMNIKRPHVGLFICIYILAQLYNHVAWGRTFHWQSFCNLIWCMCYGPTAQWIHVYVWMCMYIHIHTHTHTHLKELIKKNLPQRSLYIPTFLYQVLQEFVLITY